MTEARKTFLVFVGGKDMDLTASEVVALAQEIEIIKEVALKARRTEMLINYGEFPEDAFVSPTVKVEDTNPHRERGYITLSFLDPIDQFLLDDKKINAIQQYRAVTGLGLKESKDWCELRQGRLKNNNDVRGRLRYGDSLRELVAFSEINRNAQKDLDWDTASLSWVKR